MNQNAATCSTIENACVESKTSFVLDVFAPPPSRCADDSQLVRRESAYEEGTTTEFAIEVCK